jgi:hypothetical protein
LKTVRSYVGLDRDFPFGRPHVAWAVFRPAFVSEDCLYSLQVQQRSAAIDQGLEDLLHAPTNLKDQISAILHLVVGEVIPKPAALPFVKVERKRQTGAVNQPLTDVTQSPYSPLCVYRAYNPRWAFAPDSGHGAATAGGRFNPVGMPALFTALIFETVWLVAQQAFPFKAQPMTLCAHEVDCEDILDLTDTATLV